MKKAIFVLAILLFVFVGCYEDITKYSVKFIIETEQPITTNVIYQVDNNEKNVSLSNIMFWESEEFTITDESSFDHYYYISIDSHESDGCFFIIVNNDKYDYSEITSDNRIDNWFSGYIFMNESNHSNVNITLE